jgi:hypothetical protein
MADADFVVSATLVAVTVTVFGLGTEPGAVNSPPVETVPVVELPPCAPFTLQVTAVLEEPETVAVKDCAAPVTKVAVVGEMLTEIEVAAVTVKFTAVELPPPGEGLVTTTA